MKKKYMIIVLLLSIVMIVTAFPAAAQTEEHLCDECEYEAGQVIFMTEPGTSKRQTEKIAEDAEGELVSVSTMGDGSKIALIEVAEGEEQNAAAILNSGDRVVAAQPNYKYELDDYPNDPYVQYGMMDYLFADPLTDEYNAGSINAAGAWEQVGNSELPSEEKILVGVIDSGVRLDHADLQDVLVSDLCVTYNNGNKLDFRAEDGADDDYGHGTSVTGIIAANINNGIGVCGVAGGRSKVFVVDVVKPDKTITTYDLTLGIHYATDQGAKIINMSISGTENDPIQGLAVKYAWDHGTLVFCCAGNKGTAFPHYPSDFPYAVGVMSHNWEGNSSSFTNFGIDRDISAPGESLATTSNLRKTAYKMFTGTSAASPTAAGAAALLLSKDPTLTPRELKNLLYTSSGTESFSAEKSGHGFGMINLDTAMRNLLSEKTAPEKIVLNRTSTDIFKGQETYIEYAVYPGNTNCVDAVFSSSNEDVASVDEDGIIRAKEAGTAAITVSCEGAAATCNVNVKEAQSVTIDRKPYYATGTFTLDAPKELFPRTSADGQVTAMCGYFCQSYLIDLEKDEIIQAFLKSKDVDLVICIKDMDGNIVAMDDFNKADKPSLVTFKAEQAGTYQLLAIHDGDSSLTEYYLKIASNRAYVDPSVSSTDYGQMRMTWPAVKDADCYRVRKYSDKELTKVESEMMVHETRFVDTEYDSDKVGYYTVTACMQTSAGLFFCGESPLVVKMNNPLSAKGNTVKVKAKKLKSSNIVLKRAKVIRISNAKGNLKFTKLSGNKKIKINKTTGNVTVGKKLKKGIYKVKAKVMASGNAAYQASSWKTVTFEVRVD